MPRSSALVLESVEACFLKKKVGDVLECDVCCGVWLRWERGGGSAVGNTRRTCGGRRKERGGGKGCGERRWRKRRGKKGIGGEESGKGWRWGGEGIEGGGGRCRVRKKERKKGEGKGLAST